jgi:hypothetical protein
LTYSCQEAFKPLKNGETDQAEDDQNGKIGENVFFLASKGEGHGAKWAGYKP